ncbi:MAG: class I SAM-dependent methyltransferase [Candidatus Koribacter versatilis]|uniref:Class I SAM-dependent methyltransferase n=1 Tax=Candidatus Korobacter versatilis TaxID=658062 RepID=A0A932EPE6_9BACT|nr:class I SAM-dependent methyltransferase [Candidatus Koribacter versatilis]
MKVERYFQQQADSFDRLYETGGAWQHLLNRTFRKGLYERVRLALEDLGQLGPHTLLDVGCGSGRNEPLFVTAGATRVTGIDFSPRMLELARSFTKASGVDRQCEFIEGDFLGHAFPEKFDAVVALGVFDYFADPVKPLTRMRELARKRVIASFPQVSLVRAPLRKLRYALRNCPVYFYRQEALWEFAKQAGLKARIVPYASSGLLLIGEPA